MHGIISEKKIDIRLQFLDGNCGGIDCMSQNNAASEFSAILDNKIFTLQSEPIGSQSDVLDLNSGLLLTKI